MSTRQDYVAAIDKYIANEELPLGKSEKELAIAQAVKIHSKYKPEIYVVDITGLGTDYFDYSITTYLTSWAEGFSSVTDIEYPLDDDDEDIDIIPRDTWTVYEKPSGKVIRLLEDLPDTDEELRVWYTGLYVCTDSSCTIDDYDEEAVQALAASIFCTMLATYYAETQDNTMEADSVDHTNKSKEYAIRARIYKNIYLEHMGIKDIKI